MLGIIAAVCQHQVNVDKTALKADQQTAQQAANDIMTSCPQCCWGTLQINGCSRSLLKKSLHV